MKGKTPEINFLARQKTAFLLQSKRMYLIQILSFGTLIAYGFVLVSLISYSAFLSYSLGQVNKKIDKEGKALGELATVEMKYYGLKNKTSKILGVTQSLYKHHEIMEMVFKMLPPNLSVKSFSIDEEGNLTFSATTPNIEVLGNLFENVEQYKTYKSLTADQIVVSSVKVNDEGDYSFGLTLKLSSSQGS